VEKAMRERVIGGIILILAGACAGWWYHKFKEHVSQPIASPPEFSSPVED
jgi:hypothetical protein